MSLSPSLNYVNMHAFQQSRTSPFSCVITIQAKTDPSREGRIRVAHLCYEVHQHIGQCQREKKSEENYGALNYIQVSLLVFFFFHIFLSLHKEICISFALSLRGLAKSPSISSPLGHEVNQPGKLHLLYATLATFFNSKTDPMTYTALVFSLFEMKNSTYIIKCVLYSNQAVTY